MARYVFTYVVDGACKIYEESTPEEEKLDFDENGNRLVEMTGGGYLAFWKRCKTLVNDYKRIAMAYRYNSIATDEDRDAFPLGEEAVGTITNLDSGMEKVIA